MLAPLCICSRRLLMHIYIYIYSTMVPFDFVCVWINNNEPKRVCIPSGLYSPFCLFYKYSAGRSCMTIFTTSTIHIRTRKHIIMYPRVKKLCPKKRTGLSRTVDCQRQAMLQEFFHVFSSFGLNDGVVLLRLDALGHT